MKPTNWVELLVCIAIREIQKAMLPEPVGTQSDYALCRGDR